MRGQRGLKSVFASLRFFLHEVLDAVMPPKERALRTKSRLIKDIRLRGGSAELQGMRIATVLRYEDAATRDLIQALKYDGSLHAARLAAEALADWLREELAAARLYSKREIVLVPMPLHPARRKARGFNQIERVLEALPEEFKDGTLSEIETFLLARTRDTPQQTRLSKTDRARNVRGAFALTSPASLRDCHVFLIDDVATTGATLASAALPLSRSGAEVTLIALARA